MDFLTIVFLVYSFIAFYFLILFLLIYFQNRREFFDVPPMTKAYTLSLVIPCYNEQNTIEKTVKAVLDMDYEGLKKIFVVDDCSSDNSYKIIKRLARKYPQVVALQTPKNTGKASGAKNYGARFAKTDVVGFTDADSYPQKGAVDKMMGFFDDAKVGAVTSSVLVDGDKKFIERLQAIEYRVIAFTRKLLGFVDAIYVTPGPLALYRKKIFDKMEGFDEENMTEDIEITWHLVAEGYTVAMAVPARVYTDVPQNFKEWFRQRIRWNVGGLQTINKYRNIGKSKGMLGYFIVPFFVLSWLLGITGLFILGYRAFRIIIVNYLSSVYSVRVQTAILSLEQINLAPNILMFFGIILFFLSISFTFLALVYSKDPDRNFKRYGLIGIAIYMFVYLLVYPLILITSIFKYFTGRHSW